MLSDQATIVGISSTDRKTIIKKSIIDRSVPVVTYAYNFDYVYTLAVDEPSNVLFAGSYNQGSSQVVQYDLSTGQVLKNYGQVGICRVLSSARVGNLWLFGGFTSKITVIDSAKRRVVHEPVTTAISRIFSMTVCSLQNGKRNSKTLLFVVGRYPDYSDAKTDVLDISGLVNAFSSQVKCQQPALPDVLNKRAFGKQ